MRHTPIFSHHRGTLREQLLLLLRVVAARIRHVVKHVIRVDVEPALQTTISSALTLAVRPGQDSAVPLCDLDEPLRAERPLRVDVQCLALAAALINRELHTPSSQPSRSSPTREAMPHGDHYLARHAECVAYLSLAAAKFTVQLGDGARLEPA
jgi:hypothetical protein